MDSRIDPRLHDLARREAHRLRNEAIARAAQRLWQALRLPAAPAPAPRGQPCHS